MNEKPAKPKRRRFSYSLRTLLLVMLICGLGFGWLAAKIHHAEEQRKVVAWVREMGGFVEYDYEFDEDGDPSAPAWLRNLFGIDLFSEVIFVGLGRTSVSDVAPLVGLENLTALSISFTQVNDVTPLAKLTKLEYLDLRDTQVRDLALLAGLSNLISLNLRNTPVCDVTALAELTNLTSLDLSGTQVSKESVEQLRQALPNCVISSD